MSSLSSAHSLTSNVTAVLRDIVANFGNKLFVLHESQLFPPYDTRNAYVGEDRNLRSPIRIVLLVSILSLSNAIAIHTIYKVKVQDH